MSPVHNGARTTCLFCSNIVLLKENFNKENKNAKKSKLLKNLCSHLNINADGIPMDCVPSVFPFCGICEGLLVQLWNYQETLDRVKLKIAKVVTTIEILVADGEILNPSGSSLTGMTEPRSVGLRNSILEGYRKKLLLKQEIQNNAILNEIASLAIMKLENRDNINSPIYSNTQLSPNPTENSEHSETIVGNEVDIDEEVVDVPQSSSSQVFKENLPLSLPHLKENGGLLQTNNDSNESDADESSNPAKNADDDDWTIDSDVIAQYNSDDSPVLIPSNEESREGKTTYCLPDLSKIKREVNSNSQPMNKLDVNEQSGFIPENESINDDEIFILDPRKRRVIVDGIEIYKLTTTCNPNEEILQCSLCYQTVQMSKRLLKGEMSSFTKMKLHIYTVHKDATTRREYTCTICSKTFSKRQHLRDHRKTHPPSQRQFAFECDICGRRPIKSTSYVNLLSHKFSHKNDEERKTAILAGEKGTCKKTLLATRRIKKPRQKAPGKIQEPNNVLPVDCHICNRSFARQGHLGRHLKVHSNLALSQNKSTGGSRPPVFQFQGEFPSVSYHTDNIQTECFLNTEQPTTVEVLCDPVEILSIQKDQPPIDDGAGVYDNEYLNALLLKIETI